MNPTAKMILVGSACAVAGCASAPVQQAPRTTAAMVAPATQPGAADAIALDSAQVRPMYREILAIDLPTVARVAQAENFDILIARQQVQALRGRYESAIGTALPALVPAAAFEHLQGTTRAVEGQLVGANFTTFQPTIAVQWALNPGRVIGDIVTARKRWLASEHEERAVMLETLRSAAVQYNELALNQANISLAARSLAEAEELVRIARLRLRAAQAVPADVSRAEARLAERQGDLITAIDGFYRASIALALTLRMDPGVTLVPGAEHLPVATLVRDELSLDELLAIAVLNRPDLESVRLVVEAVAAERGAVWWGALGPQFQVNYQYGGITGHADNVVPGEGIPNNLILNPGAANGAFSPNPLVNGAVREAISRASQRLAGRRDATYGFTDQHRAGAGLSWRLSFSAFGDLKSADAARQQAIIEADRQLERVKADVVTSMQGSRTNRELIDVTRRQVDAAQESLRLVQANLKVGTATTLDVLQSEDAVTQARFRYAGAVVRYNQAQINLLAALGLLEESVLTG